tara:strand:- start:3054 stop:4349 length:1296 start_codon:yes stop_codon:yes gene_type:complete
MQQPRQLYGLGSFVKKAVGKVTKPFTKVAKKIVPKEVAGIMRVAAPFLPAGYREAAYLLGTAKQTGRISPIDLALTLAPTIGKIETSTGQTVGQRLGAINAPFTGGKSIGEVLVGKKSVPLGDFPGMSEATEGILGSGGKMFQFGGDKGIVDQFRDFRDQSKLGSLLLEGDKGTFSPAKVAGLGVGVLSLIQNSKTPEEAGTALAQATGNSDDYDRGYQLFSSLPQGIFDVPERFRLNSADGGIMRTNYAKGSDDDKPVLPEDPTKPINPFGPKPIKPLGDMKMAEFDLKDYMEEFERVFPEMIEKRGTQEYMDMLEDYFRGLASKDREGIMMAKEGGRANLALGTKPTAEESGLGGLPIEADMRYTGGFMPYGAKEKADDVPARLSKNEFVFTADAVRAAGGGSVNQGAKKMYQAMKQLEAKPEAKGMTA